MELLISVILLQLLGIISASISSEQCPSVVDERLDCGFPGISDSDCSGKGCCWEPCHDCDSSVPWCFHPLYEVLEECMIPSVDREDCGFYGIDRDECETAGCCWAPSHENNVPWCYHSVSDGQEYTTTTEVPVPVMPDQEGDIRYVYGNSGVVRLASPAHSYSSQPEGLVQVSHNGEWGTVCDDGLTAGMAAVICRDFGETNGYMIPALGLPTDTPILLDDVMCTGSESSLTECQLRPWGEHDCSHSEDVRLRCYTYEGTDEEEEGSLRLVNAAGEEGGSSGMVEVKHHGMWGSVCAIDQQSPTATFLCRKFGFVVGTTSQASYVTPDYEPITLTWLNYLNCYQPIDSINDCLNGRDEWGIHTCYPSSLNLLNCVESGTSGVEDGTLKLGENGVLEVSMYGIWGYVCGESFGYAESEVACRSLGLPGGRWLDTTTYVDDDALYWMVETNCHGDEENLMDCQRQPEITSCYKGPVAINCVTIPEKEPGEEGEIRLLDGDREAAGRVEIFHDGSWGTVCRDSVSKNEIQVICKQLGYNSGDWLWPSRPGRPSTPIHLDDIDCSGEENNLGDCYHAPWGEHNCDHDEDVGIICRSDDYYGHHGYNIEVRLVGGSSSNEGRLEVNVDEQGWSTVCDDMWDDKDARTVCRQLGYESGTAVGEAHFGQGNGNIGLNSVRCFGHEESLGQCRSNLYNPECTHAEDAGVICA